MQTVPQFFKKAHTRGNKSYDCVTFAARKINIGKFQHKKTNVMVVTDVAVSKDYVKELYIVSLASKGKKRMQNDAEWVLYFKGAEPETRERGARRTSLTRESRFVLASR